MTASTVTLTDRGLISVRGPDAQKFLQDLVTADIDRLPGNGLTYSGLLTPQGKVLFDFFVIREEHAYAIDCLLAQRDELIKRLKFYRLRAKLDIEADDRSVAAVEDDRVVGALRDPRSDGMGARLYGSPEASEGTIALYHARRIGCGLAEGGHDFGSGEIYPHEANFDQIGALSFRKGCFVGQEVVSRMEHRGTARSRILPCRVEGSLPARGSPITAADKALGSACSGVGDRMLALLRLDRLEDAVSRGLPVMAGESRVFPDKAPWASYSVATAGSP
jgi:tRNA-modifying protein YgfZ